jgi:AraC-like DNA-binding protein
MRYGLAFELAAELLSDNVPAQNSCAVRARDIALSSFRNPVTLMTIAEELQLNPSHVARAFKAQYGVTVGEFIRNARLNYAVRRLSDSDVPIGIISLESGFYDQNHFTSQFRQAMGITP